MHTKIYTMTHKEFDIPYDTMYVPLQVGAACHEKLGYLRDDKGDNISDLNCYYSELTGLYWVWKNEKEADYVGICHYRRYLLNEDGYMFTEKELEKAFEEYDILTSKKLLLNFSYFYGFGENHNPTDLVHTGRVIKKLYPDFYPLYEKRVHENHTYFGNIMYCSKSILDDYCQFLFPIFEELSLLIDLDSYDDYHKRLYGFISEFLLMVWCEYRQLKVKECKVGITGEKKETRETKEALDRFFKKNDIYGAKDYFLTVKANRPDILMEASDISGELHLCLQLISTWEFEMDRYGKTFIPFHLPFKELMVWIEAINTSVRYSYDYPQNLPDNASDVAVDIARRLNPKRK